MGILGVGVSVGYGNGVDGVWQGRVVFTNKVWDGNPGRIVSSRRSDFGSDTNWHSLGSSIWQ